MTVRSEGQFNTVVYEDYDLYRGQDRRDVILMHPDDVERLGLNADQRVTVRSEVGMLKQYPRKALRQHQARQRADVLSRGQRPGATARRSCLANAGLQERGDFGGTPGGAAWRIGPSDRARGCRVAGHEWGPIHARQHAGMLNLSCASRFSPLAASRACPPKSWDFCP